MILMIIRTEVSFNWNENQLTVFEDEGVVHDLSIIKMGNNEPNITIRVHIVTKNDTDEAQRGTEYKSHWYLKKFFCFFRCSL